MGRSNKSKNIEELNKRLLGESFHSPDGTPIGVDHNHRPIVKEDHANTDQEKIDYIVGALGKLDSDDLFDIYKSVEEYDPDRETDAERLFGKPYKQPFDYDSPEEDWPSPEEIRKDIGGFSEH